MRTLQKILITGGAGFIGYHMSKYIAEKSPDCFIYAIDNMNPYYDVELKRGRIKNLKQELAKEKYFFHEMDICDPSIKELFDEHKFDAVVHLAAQAGVRYAKENPESYIKSNVEGFFNIINNASKQSTLRFLYASSSSVYGNNTDMPFTETDKCQNPMSLYAATKLSNEMIASSYFFTHKFRSIGLRFFNVYGEWGRPDMAYFKWADCLVNHKSIELRDNGDMYRDMTYVDDVVKAIYKLMTSDKYDHFKSEIFNIGNRDPVLIRDVLYFLEEEIGIKAVEVINTPRGSEEPDKTWSNTDRLWDAISFRPNTHYRIGLTKFVEWYANYYKY